MSMIPLFRPRLEQVDVLAGLQHVLASGHIAEGPEVERFEYALAEVLQTRTPPVAVNSGTAALQLALELAGVGPGDEVITTPMTCIATNVHIVHRGARIVWADVDRLTGNIDPISVDRHRSDRTRAIVAVDWSGRPCDFRQLRAGGIPVIEDAAHAFLAGPTGRLFGRDRGDYVCWSFQAIKHLTTGDGGALHTDDPAKAERARRLRWFGLDRKAGGFRAGQDIGELGYKLHMNDLAAAIGMANLPTAADAVTRHRANAWTLYTAFTPDLVEISRVQLPDYDAASSYWFFNLLVDDRDSFCAHMADLGIETSRVHARNDLVSALAEFRCNLPALSTFDRRQVAIPCGWWLSDSDVNQIIEGVQSWANK